MKELEIKEGKHVAFENWEGRRKYSGSRIGKVVKIIGNTITIQLSNGVKMRINKSDIKGIVWFKKIRKIKGE